MSATWQELQEKIVTEIRVAMVRQKLTGKDICAIAGITQSHWSRVSNCKKPMSIGVMTRIGRAVGLRIQLNWFPTSAEPVKTACSLDTDGDGDCHLCHKFGGCKNYRDLQTRKECA